MDAVGGDVCAGGVAGRFSASGGLGVPALVEGRRRLSILLAGRDVGDVCELSDSRLLHVVVDLETDRLGTVPAVDDAAGPSPHCGSSGPSGRVGISGGVTAGAAPFQLLSGSGAGWSHREPGVS